MNDGTKVTTTKTSEYSNGLRITNTTNLHKSAFVDQAQGSQGLQAARQRYPDVVTMNAHDKQLKQDAQTNQPVNTPSMSTNMGNCQGNITKIIYVKDTPA